MQLKTLDVKCLHMSLWLGRLGDYSLHYDDKFGLPFFYQLLINMKRKVDWDEQEEIVKENNSDKD